MPSQWGEQSSMCNKHKIYQLELASSLPCSPHNLPSILSLNLPKSELERSGKELWMLWMCYGQLGWERVKERGGGSIYILSLGNSRWFIKVWTCQINVQKIQTTISRDLGLDTPDNNTRAHWVVIHRHSGKISGYFGHSIV